MIGRAFRNGAGRDIATAAEFAWYIAGAVVALYSILVGVVGTLSLTSGYCATCHGDARRSLDRTVHAQQGCDSCHGEVKPMRLVVKRLASVRMVQAAVVPVAMGVDAPVSDEMCMGCHSDVRSGVVVANGIRMSHSEVIVAGIGCSRCHRSASHEQAPATVGEYTMEVCTSCHASNPGNVSTCDVCHADASATSRPDPEGAWAVAHGTNWRKAHPLPGLDSCAACHTDGYCDRCHEVAMPHAPTYAPQHGADAKKRGRDACVPCHDLSACDRCHGVEMPHPDGFTQAHSKLVRAKGVRACRRCHDRESCETCHEAHVHPGIPEEQLKLLKASPVVQ